MTHRIQPTTTQNAPDATKPLLDGLQKGLGMVPNVFAAIGHSPGALASLLAWDQALAKGSLKKREIEQLNLHVSELNGCGYCLSAHGALGARAGLDAAQIEAARDGRGQTERENALLALARRIVRSGGAQSQAELARAREAGVSDAELVDVLAIVALKTFTNAVAIAGKVDVDFPRQPRLPAG